MAVKPKYNYEPYEQTVTLCKDIKDLYPYTVTLPDLPPVETITNYGKKPEEQFFQRVVMPPEIKKLNQLPREEAMRIAEESTEISAFIEKMWYHMAYGDFQFINGRPLHISPTYWFYLNFWKNDRGLPKFRYDLTHYCTDLWEFIFWDYLVIPSPVCYGSIEGTKRRIGKTYKAMCKAYKQIAFSQNKNCCIQSKTDEDAAEAFTEKMVMPVTNLPFFFKPAMANSTFPKKEGFQFFPRTNKAKNQDDSIDPEDFLFSKIVYKNSGEKAADGYKWHIHISDEDGKAEKINVWERHTIVKPCLTEDGKIIGKEIATTTVEDMEKGGGEMFCYKWKLSNRDPHKKKEQLTVRPNGETMSGLWPWFQPSRCAEIWDKFGKAIIDDPNGEEMAWLRDVMRDPQWMKGGRERVKERVESYANQLDRQREARKYPEEIRDMFVSASGYCHFDAAILNERMKYFAFGYQGTELESKMSFVNLYWKNERFGDVGFTHGESPEKSKFWLSFIPRQELWNKHIKHPFNGKKSPANWDKFVSGADPFKFDTDEVIHKNKMSTAAMHIYAEYDPMTDTPDVPDEDRVTGDICGEYFWREDQTVEEMCEDYAMACIFFGMKVFPEKNNKDVITYFRQWGLENYLQFDMKQVKGEGAIYLKETSPGSNTDPASVQSMFRVVQKYVKEKGMRCKFPRTIEQLLDVTPENMQHRDLFVSLAKCLQVVMDFNPTYATDEPDEDVGDIMGALNGFLSQMPISSGDFGRDVSDWNN